MLILLSFLSKITDKEDLPEKAKPYFRYPESDPYFGFYSEENRTMEDVNEVIVLNGNYWDCECEKDYIRPKSKPECFICNTCEDDQPDSRADEVAAALAEVELWPSIETRHHYQVDGWVEMSTKIDVLARSEEEAIEIAQRVFDERVSDMYNASITNFETVEHDWYSPICGDLEISDCREYDGDSCYTLESTEELR